MYSLGRDMTQGKKILDASKSICSEFRPKEIILFIVF